MQKSHNINIKSKVEKTNFKNKRKNTNNKAKVVVGAYVSREKKGGLYNIYHELISDKWIIKRSRFHAS